jgi:hypothetical protein
VLGFKTGGDNGSGIKLTCCFVGRAVACMLLNGDVIISGDQELFPVTIGLARSGLGSASCTVSAGDDGGDGVDVVERKVGPRAGETGDTACSCKSECAFATDRDASRVDGLFGTTDEIV